MAFGNNADGDLPVGCEFLVRQLLEFEQVFYCYDGLGRRIETRIRERRKEDEDILLEYDRSNELCVSYLHGPSVDEPLSFHRVRI